MVSGAEEMPLDIIDAECRPGENGRIDVVERPLVRRKLTVWMLKPLARQQLHLCLGKVRIDSRQRNTVEGEIQDAYHGYSHVSGIDRTFAFAR